MRLDFRHHDDMLLGYRHLDGAEMRASASQFDFKIRDRQLLAKGSEEMLEQMVKMARPWMERLHRRLLEEQADGPL